KHLGFGQTGRISGTKRGLQWCGYAFVKLDQEMRYAAKLEFPRVRQLGFTDQILMQTIARSTFDLLPTAAFVFDPNIKEISDHSRLHFPRQHRTLYLVDVVYCGNHELD